MLGINPVHLTKVTQNHNIFILVRLSSNAYLDFSRFSTSRPAPRSLKKTLSTPVSRTCDLRRRPAPTYASLQQPQKYLITASTFINFKQNLFGTNVCCILSSCLYTRWLVSVGSYYQKPNIKLF